MKRARQSHKPHSTAMLALVASARVIQHAVAISMMLGSVAVTVTHAAEPAAAAVPRQYAIGAGALGDVLAQYAALAGAQLVFDPTLLSGLKSPGLQGSYSVREGFAKLLSDSGYEAVAQTGGSFVLRKVVQVLPASATPVGATNQPVKTLSVLKAVEVEDPSGPVNGYVAKRSATATKTDTPIIEIPQSISVVSGEQMRATNAQSLQQALAYTPGIAAGASANNAATVDSFFLRGFQADGQFGSFYRDGMRYQANISNGKQEPFGIERVEYLKGPSSILYGAAAPGGVINTVTKRPQSTPYREINLEFGSFNRKQVSADLTGPVDAAGKLAYRLTALGRDSETFVDFGRDDRIYIAPAVTWHPAEQTSVTLLTSYQKVEQSDPGVLPARGTLLANPNGEIDRSRYVGEPTFSKFNTEITNLGYVIEHAFSDRLQLSHKLRHYDGKLHNEFVLLGAFDGRTLQRQSRFHKDNTSVLTSDTSLQYSIDSVSVRQVLLFGVDYTRSEYGSVRLRGSYAPLDVFNPVYGSSRTLVPLTTQEDNRRQFGIYLQDQIKVGGRWVFLLGARHDAFDNEFISTTTTATTRTEDKQGATTGRAGVVYLADYGLAPYVSYSQSFYPNAGIDRFGNAFEPDEGEQYEVGIRLQPDNARFMLSAAAYQLTRSNVLTPDPANFGFSIAAGEVRARGFEFEAKGQVTRSFSLIGGYGYTDARIIKTTVAQVLDSRFSNAPFHTAALLADVNFSAIGMPNLVAGAGFRYVSEKPGNTLVDGTISVPGYTLFDARLAYESDAWRYALNISNLGDKRYIPSACVGSGVRGCDYGEPRRTTVSVSYIW